MLRRTILILCLLISFSAGGLTAQQDADSASLQQLQNQYQGTATSEQSSAEKVNTTVKRSKNVIPAGTSFRAAVLLNIAENWHVNAHEPSMKYLIGTSLELNEPAGFQMTAVEYPDPEKLSFEFAGKPLSVYEGKVPIIATFKTSDTLRVGRHVISGSVRVQACNDAVCLAPSRISVELPVEITEPQTGFKRINTKLFGSRSVADRSLGSVFEVRGRKDVASLFDRFGWWALVGIFLIGLALNLTPCVYPMLSVTVSLFGGQAGERRSLGRSFTMASIYVSGIVVMYSALGLAAAFTGNLFGSWLQNDAVLLGIAVLIFLLALSMFGVYELQPPQWLMQRVSGAQRATGAVGHFLSGIVVGIFAAPCVGPPVLALLAYVGMTGDPLLGLSLMLVMAFGLGFPYLLLGTFSGLLGRLPQSGTWMVWVKKVFGVVLLGVALFYAAIVFFPAYSTYVIPATLFIGGGYVGFVDPTGSERKGFRYVKWALGAVSIVGGLLFVQNLQKRHIQWKSYSSEQLVQARSAGHPVMMDFYADWCLPCLKMDRVTFTDARIIDASESFAKIKVDLTDYTSPRARKLRKKYEVMGLPTIVFLGPNGQEIEQARTVGFAGPDKLLKRIRKVKRVQ